MGKKFYALREPRDDKSWNIYALKEAAKLKKWLIGVYYSDELKRLLIIFNTPPKTHVNRLVFEELSERVVKESYLMVCPEGCGRCCIFQSNAFMLSSELKGLPESFQAQVRSQPVEKVDTPGGVVRVYKLGTGSLGMCSFFNPITIKCSLEEACGKTAKPIICLITYCTIFAKKGDALFLKTGYKELADGRVAMFYRQATQEEWRRALTKMASTSARYRKAKEDLTLS